MEQGQAPSRPCRPSQETAVYLGEVLQPGQRPVPELRFPPVSKAPQKLGAGVGECVGGQRAAYCQELFVRERELLCCVHTVDPSNHPGRPGGRPPPLVPSGRPQVTARHPRAD